MSALSPAPVPNHSNILDPREPPCPVLPEVSPVAGDDELISSHPPSQSCGQGDARRRALATHRIDTVEATEACRLPSIRNRSRSHRTLLFDKRRAGVWVPARRSMGGPTQAQKPSPDPRASCFPGHDSSYMGIFGARVKTCSDNRDLVPAFGLARPRSSSFLTDLGLRDATQRGGLLEERRATGSEAAREVSYFAAKYSAVSRNTASTSP